MNNDIPQQPTETDNQNAQDNGAASRSGFTRPTRQGVPKAAVVGGVSILLLVAGAVAYMLVASPFSAKQTSHDPWASTTKFQSAEAAVAAVKPQVSGKILDVAESNGVRAVSSSGYFAYGPPAAAVSGSPFAVLPLTSSGAGYTGNSVVSSENYNTLVGFFERNKFKKVQSYENEIGPLSDSNEEVRYVAYSEYESSNLRCSVLHADASGTALKNHVVSLGCAEKQSYEQAAKLLRPLYSAYVKTNKTTPKNVMMGLARNSSDSKNYEYIMTYQEEENSNADASGASTVSQLNGYYYKAASSNEWTLFKVINSNDTPACSVFDTAELRSAFKGVECHDESKKGKSAVGV